MERRFLHWDRMVRTSFWIVQRMPFTTVTLKAGFSGSQTFGNIVFVDSGAIDFDSAASADGDLFLDGGTDNTVGGTLSVTATAGGITDSATIAVTGDLTLNDVATAGITLDTLEADANVILTAAGNTAITNDAALALQGAVTGTLNVTSGGAITQNGSIDADSTASFTAGANAITLTDAGNDFSGAVSLSNSGTNDVALTDTNALDLGTVSVGQDLTVTTGGDLTDSGAITVAGLGTIVSISQNINLGDSTTANFGSIDFAGANVSIKEGSAMELAASEATGTLTLEAAGAITQTGAIDADSAANFVTEPIRSL